MLTILIHPPSQYWPINQQLVLEQVPAPQFNHWKEDPIKTTMDQQEEIYIVNWSPILRKEKYIFWSTRMKIYLKALGHDVWNLVITDYFPPKRIRTLAQNKSSNKTYWWFTLLCFHVKIMLCLFLLLCVFNNRFKKWLN